MVELLDKLDNAIDCTCTGYYNTYVVDNLVIKEYLDKEEFEEDVFIHQVLDKHDLMPKMVANFYHKSYAYLVVEKIYCFDEVVEKTARNLRKSEYFFQCKKMRDSFNFNWDNKVREYRKEVKKHKINLGEDDHIGNFGLTPNGTFVALDEGLFWCS